MVRLRCKKCGNVFEKGFSGAVLAPHVGPYHVMKCPACGKRGWFNVYSSIKDPVTWPQEKQEQAVEPELTEEELEKKRIEESKYENRKSTMNVAD